MRKREQERRIERSVQKEREKEGDEFADKESFVTAAYPFAISGWIHFYDCFIIVLTNCYY